MASQILILSNIFVSIITSLTPMIEINDLLKNLKSAHERSCITYASLWLNYTLWSAYGVLKGNVFPVGLINIWGILISSYYCYIFFYCVEYCDKKRVFYTYFFSILFSIIIIVYCQYSAHPQDIIESRVGFVASLVSILMMASPLSMIPIVLQKGTNMISFPLSVMYNTTAALWCIYGLMIQDPYIIKTNIVGGIVSFLGLTLFVFVPSSYDDPKNIV